MGVYIKGMEMPKNCHSCPMCLMRFCQAGDKELSEQETRPNAKRPEDCPLVPVPEHGRLGDLYELKVKIKKEDNGYSWDSYGDGMYDAFQSVYQCIDTAPTIIPEED